jgi:aspartate aminotransferase-like enzyme
MRDKYGLLIGNGLGVTAKFNLRIAHMGYCNVEDMLQCIVALEATLFEMGAINTIGKGISSFLDAYNNTI